MVARSGTEASIIHLTPKLSACGRARDGKRSRAYCCYGARQVFRPLLLPGTFASEIAFAREAEKRNDIASYKSDFLEDNAVDG